MRRVEGYLYAKWVRSGGESHPTSRSSGRPGHVASGQLWVPQRYLFSKQGPVYTWMKPLPRLLAVLRDKLRRRE